MQLDTIQVIGLMGLVMVIPLIQGIRNWQENKWRQQAAGAHGWRYWKRGWKWLLRPGYTVAGTTPAGIVWEVTRIQQRRQWYLLWTAQHRLLPYGRLDIRPRQAEPMPDRVSRGKEKLLAVGSPGWQNAYVLWATHDVLAQRYLSREAELAMMELPAWPAPGALEEITWNRDQIVMRVRHHKDWSVLDRIVVLGTALVDNAARLR